MFRLWVCLSLLFITACQQSTVTPLPTLAESPTSFVSRTPDPTISASTSNVAPVIRTTVTPTLAASRTPNSTMGAATSNVAPFIYTTASPSPSATAPAEDDASIVTELPVTALSVQRQASATPSWQYQTDSEQISIYNVATGTWMSYLYPFETDEAADVYLLADNTMRLQICYATTGYAVGFQPSSCLWHFNPWSGVFRRYIAVCGVYAPHDADTRWVSDGGVFCNMTTGEESAPLPEGFAIVGEEWFGREAERPYTIAYPNPTGEWLIFYEGMSSPTVYALHRSSGAVNVLGQIESDDPLNEPFFTWADDRHFTVHSQTIEPLTQYQYTGDVTVVNSLTETP